jgi:hypothetical protein
LIQVKTAGSVSRLEYCVDRHLATASEAWPRKGFDCDAKFAESFKETEGSALRRATALKPLVEVLGEHAGWLTTNTKTRSEGEPQ